MHSLLVLIAVCCHVISLWRCHGGFCNSDGEIDEIGLGTNENIDKFDSSLADEADVSGAGA